MNIVRRWVTGILLALFAQIGCADVVRVAVASNFIGTAKEIVEQFEQKTGHQVVLSTGSSGRLYAQIRHGAPYDIFLSADQEKPKKLEEDGLAISGTRFTYAEGVLVLWSANPGRVDDALRRGAFKKLALANSRLAPYGAAAVEVLVSMGLSDSTESKWVVGENINQVWQFVRSGNADMGFVSLSQVRALKSARTAPLWVIPSDLHEPIKQDAVLLDRARHSMGAKAFLTFLRSTAAKESIATAGYRFSR
ncbi:MAG: molybdate ABC transporter substrate-binding protein [bacterium]